jgi:hypothetical protein
MADNSPYSGYLRPAWMNRSCRLDSTSEEELQDGLPSRSSFRGGQARLRVALRRYGAASSACIHERRMVDLTGIEPVTS